MTCQNAHRYTLDLSQLPNDQSEINGRHKCAGCAYDQGYNLGLSRSHCLNIDYTTLPDSQAGSVRHKSIQAAFAQGYLNGVLASY